MLFDTHCHLNFEAFDKNFDDVIKRANKVGVNYILIPGTDVQTSKKAVMIAEKYEGIYAAVGIHPHHVFKIYSESSIPKFFIGKQQTEKNLISSLSKIQKQNHVIPVPDETRGQAPAGIQFDLIQIERLISHPKVVAIGEVGIDRHIYQKTKYSNYKIEEEFIELQKTVLEEQILLSIKYDKSLILHNREAKKDMIGLLNKVWNKKLEGRSVFHCCEPDLELFEFAKKHRMFIGVDGDITYNREKPFDFAQGKQEFIKAVPLEMLVLETDSPFLNPEPNRSKEGGTKNEPKNIPLITKFVAKLKGVTVDELSKQTTKNARKLFKISNY